MKPGSLPLRLFAHFKAPERRKDYSSSSGTGAAARRRRQIEKGQLTGHNGLKPAARMKEN